MAIAIGIIPAQATQVRGCGTIGGVDIEDHFSPEVELCPSKVQRCRPALMKQSEMSGLPKIELLTSNQRNIPPSYTLQYGFNQRLLSAALGDGFTLIGADVVNYIASGADAKRYEQRWNLLEDRGGDFTLEDQLIVPLRGYTKEDCESLFHTGLKRFRPYS